MKQTFLTLLIACVVCLLASETQAQKSYNINFTTSVGLGPTFVGLDGQSAGSDIAPASYPGTVWNDLLLPNSGPVAPGQPFQADVVDSLGNDPVNFSLTPTGGSAMSHFGYPDSSLDLISNYLFTDLMFTAPPTPTEILIEGLAAGTLWDVYLVSQGNQPKQGGSFTISSNTIANSESSALTALGSNSLTALGNNPNATEFIEGENYVRFKRVTAVGGEISIQWDDNQRSTNFAILNGLQLVQVPEPTTLGLITCLGLTLLTANRRNRSGR